MTVNKGYFYFKIPIYDQPVYVYTNYTKLAKHYPILSDSVFGSGGYSAQLQTDTGAIVNIMAFNTEVAPVDMNTIAHECTHLALCILDHVAIKVDVDNQEALAYLIGYLVGYISDRV